MKISNKNRRIIVNEFEKVIELMSNTKNTKEKLFYFSATYAMVIRILNIEYDSLLILIHLVLLSTYSSINSFLNNIVNNINAFYSMPENYFDMLETNLKNITRSIDNDNEDNIHQALKDFSVLAYITLGNGNYLYKKDIIKF